MKSNEWNMEKEQKLEKALRDLLNEISCDGELFVEIELAIRRKAKLKKAVQVAYILLNEKQIN